MNETPETITTMESWRLLDRIFPRGSAKTVAHYMHCSVDYVRRWCREPESEEGTGQPNPVDRVCHLIDVALITNPLGAALIPEFIANHHRERVNAMAVGFGGSEARREAAAEVMEKAVAVAKSLNLGAAPDETLIQFVELIETCTQAKDKVQVELKSRERSGPRKIVNNG